MVNMKMVKVGREELTVTICTDLDSWATLDSTLPLLGLTYNRHS